MADDYTPTPQQAGERYASLGDTRAAKAAMREEFYRMLAATIRQSEADALRRAAADMRTAWPGHWNLPDPRDPTISYSPDRWLEVRADRIAAGGES